MYRVNWTTYFKKKVCKIYASKKYISGLCLFFLVITNCYFSFYSERSFVQQQHRRNYQRLGLNRSKHPVIVTQRNKLILFWTSFKNNYWPWHKIFDRQLKNECSNYCTLTFNKTRILEADAVIFHATDLKLSLPQNMLPTQIYPAKRMNKQIYVLLTFEAAPGIKKIQYEVVDEDLKTRKNAAIWLASHCPTSSEREKLVEKMQSYMQVDIYGRCGNFSCGNRNLLTITKLSILEDPCRETISSYKFYLAFENALCTDYVTEKLYRALHIGIIPVVFGGANYKAVAPPNSFIDVRDFKSVIELVNYLEKVGSNATLYNSYLKWKQDYLVDLGHPYRPHSCGLCDKLHDQISTSKYQSHVNLENLISIEASCQRTHDTEKFNALFID